MTAPRGAQLYHSSADWYYEIVLAGTLAPFQAGLATPARICGLFSALQESLAPLYLTKWKAQ